MNAWRLGRPARNSRASGREREAARALIIIRQEIDKLIDEAASPTFNRDAHELRFRVLLVEADRRRQFLREVVQNEQGQAG